VRATTWPATRHQVGKIVLPFTVESRGGRRGSTKNQQFTANGAKTAKLRRNLLNIGHIRWNQRAQQGTGEK